MNCILCNKKNIGFGNNLRPLKNGGICCDNCNITKVIPHRLSMITNRESFDKYHKYSDIIENNFSNSDELKRKLSKNQKVYKVNNINNINKNDK